MKSELINILLIEDDIVDQKSFKRLVEKEQLPYTFQIAENVAEALSVIAENEFDLVITDYYLGDGTSFDIIPHLSGTPTIVTTGTGDEEVAVQAMKLGAYDYLIKDIDCNYLKVLPVTVEKAIEQQKSKEQLLVLESALSSKNANSVYVADLAGNIEWVNPGFIEKSGYRKREIIGRRGEVFSVDGETALFDNDVCNELLRNARPFSKEVCLKTVAGDSYWELIQFMPITNHAGNTKKLLGLATDITAKKQWEAEIIAARDAANKARVSKEQFLANTSHEIRTAMSGILGMSNLLMKTTMDEQQFSYLEAIKESADNLLVIINDILDFSKIEAGKIELEETEFSIRKLVGTLEKVLHHKVAEKGIYFDVNIDDNIPQKLLGDPVRLNQIILNLVGNATKFTAEGGITLDVSLQREEDKSLEVLFTVKDTGIGISPTNLQNIFSSFKQASADTTRKYGGTGLGLAITKQLIEIQGGKINVTSKVGKGSTFSFALRYEKYFDNPVEEQPAETVEIPTLEELGSLSVLLVEDNQVNQLVATQILFDWNFKVDVAFNGLQAIEKVKERAYDIILMDINMPEMDGFQATKYIRNKLDNPLCNIPIMAMTASALKGDNEKCFDVGMNDYISKPFDPDKLYEKLAALITKKRPHYEAL